MTSEVSPNLFALHYVQELSVELQAFETSFTMILPYILQMLFAYSFTSRMCLESKDLYRLRHEIISKIFSDHYEHTKFIRFDFADVQQPINRPCLPSFARLKGRM